MRDTFKVVLLLVLFFCNSVGYAATETVATGEGRSKDNAIQSALYRAVEQGVGVFIKADTKVENFQVIEDKVLSRSKGYVSKYEIIKSTKDGDDFTVTIKATVDQGTLKDDLTALGLFKTEMGNPKILVAYNRKDTSNRELSSKSFLEEIYNGIVETLTDKQFRVVDKRSAEKFSQQIAETHEIDVEINKAAAAGLKYQADYTLYYDVSGEIKKGEVFTGVRLRVKTQLIDNTRAQIIASKVVESVSSGQDLNAVIEKAARDGGKKVVAPVLELLRKAWEDMCQKGSTYTIVIDGIDDTEQIAAFAVKFENFPAVTSSREVESGGGKTTFEAEYKGKRGTLDRDILRAARELGWSLKRIRSEGARSTWKKI